jgi:hypothetical protein
VPSWQPASKKSGFPKVDHSTVKGILFVSPHFKFEHLKTGASFTKRGSVAAFFDDKYRADVALGIGTSHLHKVVHFAEYMQSRKVLHHCRWHTVIEIKAEGKNRAGHRMH